MKCKERLAKYLRENDVPFETQIHPQAFTAQEVAAAQHVSGHQVAQVVMVWADDELAMMVLPASGRVDFRRAAQAMTVKRVRLASEAEFIDRFADCKVGAMPPFGNLYDLRVVIDPSLTEHKEMVFRVGTYTETMKIATAEFGRLVRPHVAVISYGD
jgi:Ala-tRNA(Pro) deacylase